MKSHVDPSVAIRLSFSQSMYWHARDIATIGEECEWLQTRILRLGETAETEVWKKQLRLRQTTLTRLKQTSFAQSQNNRKVILDELQEFYSDYVVDSEHPIDRNDLDDLPPRLKFLLYKYNFITQLDIQLSKNFTHYNPWEEHQKVEVLTGEKRNLLKVTFDIAKKFIDILDDIWSVLKGFLSPQMFNLIGPFLTGGVGFIIHLAEAYQGIKEAWLSYRNKHETVRQRKTRGATGALIFLFGCVGAGLSISFIAGALGAAVSGMTFMPVLIPVFLIAIYSTALWKRSYIFKQSIQAETEAKKTFEEALKKITASHEDKMDDEFSALHIEVESKKQIYEFMREERLKAERNVAFNVVEVAATSIVLIGTIIGLSALIGAASFATMGIAPLTVLIIGVAIGLFCKVFERIDEKNDYKYTRGIRNLVTDTWNKLFHTNQKRMDRTPSGSQKGSYGDMFDRTPPVPPSPDDMPPIPPLPETPYETRVNAVIAPMAPRQTGTLFSSKSKASGLTRETVENTYETSYQLK